MKQDRAWLETAAKGENDWVRTVILKKDHVARADAGKIALRACDMARSALGESHPSYAVAILNMALYYAVIEEDETKSESHFEQALRLPGGEQAEYVEALYRLGAYYYTDGNAKDRAMSLWTKAVAVVQNGSEKTVMGANLLIALSCGYIDEDPKKAASLLQEAVRIQRGILGPAHPDVQDTEMRFATAIRMAAGLPQ